MKERSTSNDPTIQRSNDPTPKGIRSKNPGEGRSNRLVESF
jgi:hypothetical protein